MKAGTKKPRQMKAKSGAKTSTALVKAVAKKVVSDQLEDKYATSGAAPIVGAGYPVYFNAAIASSAECYALLPTIVQGTGSAQRIGDKITPKRLRVMFTVTANGSYQSSQINLIRLMVLEDKSIRNLQQLTGTPIDTQLIDYGGTVGGYTGIPNNNGHRINRQRYKVIKDVKKEVLSGFGTTPQLANAYVGTQVFVSGQQCHTFTVDIPTPAKLVYSRGTDGFPNNFAPFFCLGYVQPDGNAAPDNLLTRVACNWVVQFDYEDA